MAQFFLVQNEGKLNPNFPEFQRIPLEGLVVEQKYDDGKRRAIKLLLAKNMLLLMCLKELFMYTRAAYQAV